MAHAQEGTENSSNFTPGRLLTNPSTQCKRGDQTPPDLNRDVKAYGRGRGSFPLPKEREINLSAKLSFRNFLNVSETRLIKQPVSETRYSVLVSNWCTPHDSSQTHDFNSPTGPRLPRVREVQYRAGARPGRGDFNTIGRQLWEVAATLSGGSSGR